MNEVMKVLTIIATIFMPLSFIAGIYGMNFNPDVSPFNMPELNWKYGYPALIALMALVAVGMIRYFKKKKWF
jgi:magnesium transporter